VVIKRGADCSPNYTLVGSTPSVFGIILLFTKKTLDFTKNSVILLLMKAKKIKIRQSILFTKARPFKMKNKILDRKLKHKTKLTYVS
jgi:hypothetical protein